MALVLIIIIFFPNFFDIGGTVKSQIIKTGADPDKDGLKEYSDKCPCTFGKAENEGCPTGITEAQKEEDVKKFNTDTTCGILDVQGQPSTAEAEKKAGQQKLDAFGHYRSVEIYGNDDDGEPENSVIRQACPGWVGKDCPSESENCDGDEYNYQEVTDGCWVMASESDTVRNDCGQAKLGLGTIISLSEYSSLAATSGTYWSNDEEPEPENLFSWKWKSTPKYGSLICKDGLWYGCIPAMDGKTTEISGQKYLCSDQEWITQQ